MNKFRIMAATLTLIFAGSGLLLTSTAADAQGIRSETKKQQDEAERRGREAAQSRKSGANQTGKMTQEERNYYRDLDSTQKERYKRGYQQGQ